MQSIEVYVGRLCVIVMRSVDLCGRRGGTDKSGLLYGPAGVNWYENKEKIEIVNRRVVGSYASESGGSIQGQEGGSIQAQQGGSIQAQQGAISKHSRGAVSKHTRAPSPNPTPAHVPSKAGGQNTSPTWSGIQVPQGASSQAQTGARHKKRLRPDTRTEMEW